MQARVVIICGLFLATVVVALIAGFIAAQAYEDRQPARAAVSIGLAPLPGWATEPLPDFAGYSNSDDRKEAFFDYLFPRIALANFRVLTLRDQVMALAQKQSLTPKENAFLAEQAERLRIDAPVGSQELFDLLIRRLDIIPPSLAMAQAANESAWGTSRFARQGNNLFGEWCFSKGCGLVPQARAAGASHEVASFESPYQSVRSYLTNLNRHPQYRELREGRAQLRAEERIPTGPALAPGLEGYSERGDAYVDEILGMIRFNSLQQYDRRFIEWLAAKPEVDEPYVLLRNRQALNSLN